MKISLNAIRVLNNTYGCASDPAPDGVDQLIERIGAQLAAVEETSRNGDKYAGIVIVRIVDCRKHENSDHLNICIIDDGGMVPDIARNNDGYVQVVCGAPNVRTGLTVAWLPPGSTVPSSYDSEPFVLGSREIRGVLSNGMLASPKELALGDSHDGILVIATEDDDSIAPGTLLADHYGLTDDVIIDMENKMFTHRPDCFGLLGVARELAGIQGQAFTSPEWYRTDVTISGSRDETAASAPVDLKVDIRNEIPELVPRFAVVPMSGISVKPSPVWLQVELSRLGVRPINNIVDLTNYYMLLTAQPLHAYDYDKVVAQDAGADHATIVVRKPRADEKLTLLNGKVIQPRDEAIIIATDSMAIGLGGVMGGGNTEVDGNTKNIILECASFDMYSIRRTAMAHGVFTDAVTRFNKGQSPLQNVAVLARIVDDITKITGARVAGPVVDDNRVADDVRQRGAIHPDVTVTTEFINQRLGLHLSADEIAKLLRNVEFSVDTNDDGLTIRAPFWRTDIEISEDVVEEVGRLYGFDKLPRGLPRRDLVPAVKNHDFELQNAVREKLARSGANEVLTYSFVHGNLLDRTGQDRDLAFKLSNAISPELQYYRLSLTPSLLDKVHANIKSGYDEFALFEIGKAHGTSEVDEAGLPREMGRVAFVFAAEDKRAARNHSGAAYYQARKFLLTLFDGNTLPFTLVPLSQASYDGHAMIEQMGAPFDPARSAALVRGSLVMGIVGEYKSSVQKALKLPRYSAGFEVFLSLLTHSGTSAYVSHSRFPKVWQDICLRVPAVVSYQELHDYAWNTLTADQPEATSIALSPVDIYQRADDTEHTQMTFRFEITAYDRTMTDGEVAAILDTLAAAAGEKFNAVRV